MIYKFKRQHEDTLKKVLNEIKVTPPNVNLYEIDWDNAIITATIKINISVWYYRDYISFDDISDEGILNDITSFQEILSKNLNTFTSRAIDPLDIRQYEDKIWDGVDEGVLEWKLYLSKGNEDIAEFDLLSKTQRLRYEPPKKL